MSAIYILWLRELKHYVRSPAQIFTSLVQPVLYLLTLGLGLNSVSTKAGHGSYIQFLTPGVVGMTVLFSAAGSGMSLLWDRQFGFLKEALVSPVPRGYIVLGRTLGGSSRAILQGLLVLIVCMIAGFRPTSLASIPATLFIIVLIAIVFCALGTAIGSWVESIHSFSLIVDFLLLPLFFLSGALVPLDVLPPSLQYIIDANPLSYGVDGLRATLTGTTQFGFGLDLFVLISVASIFVFFGAYSFSKIQL